MGNGTTKAAEGTVLLLACPTTLLACDMAVLDAQIRLLPVRVVETHLMSSFAVLSLPCEAPASWTPSLEGPALYTQRWRHWPSPCPAWAVAPKMADPGG